ncbi:nitronate monooxygenase [candidate division KSB3 bacterium]|uniref:Nitronate monooxygenase n=1 Tax=candidate division KSB3 bacterium TaxID=2044937 RepID=A0A2G6E1B5_9BACT|nr:MAG: nitronate monooxygenase [candidate division KSB3 bacterium]PIE28426.1 MAG: nitronate monooxygenase [candidate division KSB3 bacterium]
MTLPALKIGDFIAKVPIVQGGMGIGISLSGLASAVANEGGIGVIAAAMIGIHEPGIFKDPEKTNADVLRREIRTAKENSDGVLGVNIMVALSDFSNLVKVAIKEKIDIIFSGAGLPLDLPQYLGEGVRTKLVPIVSSGRAASILCKKWMSRFSYLPDAFVVEGPMAGGHLGIKVTQLDNPKSALEHIVPQVIEAVKPYIDTYKKHIPIIAGGGIYTGEDIYKFIKMGVDGVQMGTRFVATDECDADLAFKQAYIDAKEEDVVIIKSPVGLPGQAIRNEFLDEVDSGKKTVFKCPYRCISTCDYKKAPYCIGSALANAKKGKLRHGFAFAGKNAYRVDKIMPVKMLINLLREQYAACCP